MPKFLWIWLCSLFVLETPGHVVGYNIIIQKYNVFFQALQSKANKNKRKKIKKKEAKQKRKQDAQKQIEKKTVQNDKIKTSDKEKEVEIE